MSEQEDLRRIEEGKEVQIAIRNALHKLCCFESTYKDYDNSLYTATSRLTEVEMWFERYVDKAPLVLLNGRSIVTETTKVDRKE